MPKTCCTVQPKAGPMRRATSGTRRAPPTWSTRRLDRSNRRSALASSQRMASAGTRAVTVTPSASTAAMASSGFGDGAMTTRPPAASVPMRPGQPSGKLWAAGSATR